MNSAITRVTVTDEICFVTVSSLKSFDAVTSVLSLIANENINVDMITQSSSVKNGLCDLSFSINNNDLSGALRIINQFKTNNDGINVEVITGNSKICVFGEAMKDQPGVAASVFALLSGVGVEVRLITTSEIDISILISETDCDKALDAIKV